MEIFQMYIQHIKHINIKNSENDLMNPQAPSTQLQQMSANGHQHPFTHPFLVGNLGILCVCGTESQPETEAPGGKIDVFASRCIITKMEKSYIYFSNL